ncbi:MAG: hypothetical protein IJX74_01730 [Clostridia bacterium]|nr:hypothetical protein [Clostridia bacterium]
MNNTEQKRIVVMLSILARGKSKQYLEMLNSKNIKYHLQSVGFGTAPSEMMDIFGLGSNDKDIIFSLAPVDDVSALAAELTKNIDSSARYGGLAVILSLSSINRLTSEIIYRANRDADNAKKGVKTAKMKNELKHNLIAISVNQGYTDEVMKIAKQFGATGGTVIRARLAGSQNLEQFDDNEDDSISVEKEIITILAPANICKQIMEEVNSKYGLNSEARGTICSVPVEKAFKI